MCSHKHIRKITTCVHSHMCAHVQTYKHLTYFCTHAYVQTYNKTHNTHMHLCTYACIHTYE